MELTSSEKIRIIIQRKNITVSELASAMNTSRQNLTNKLKRDNFKESELQEIASALDCKFKGVFIINETGEEI